MIDKLKGSTKAALLTVGPVSWLCFALLPYEVSMLSHKLSITEDKASIISSIELVALSILAVIGGKLITKIDNKLLTIFGLLLSLVGLFVSAQGVDYQAVLIGKVLFGSGVGLVTATTSGLPSEYENPEKTYAQMFGSMAVVTSIIMFVFPQFADKFGLNAIEVIESIVVGVAIFASFFLPKGQVGATVSDEKLSSLSPKALRGITLTLISVFLLFVAQTVGWAFALAAAEPFQLSESSLSASFTVNSLIQIPASMLIAWVGTRAGFIKPIVAAALVVFFVIWGCFYGNGTSFLIAICIGSLGSTLAYPYILGALAELDHTGRTTALAGGTINFGAAVGPAIGGISYASMGLNGVGVVSLILTGLFLVFAVYGLSYVFKKDEQNIQLTTQNQ